MSNYHQVLRNIADRRLLDDIEDGGNSQKAK